ncbi:MAG: hypothetical protein ACE5O2_14855, partial [Armatimonadota bacterium]
MRTLRLTGPAGGAALGGCLMLLIGTMDASSTPAGAATYYVSNDGSDDNDGASPDRPWRTIRRVNAQQLRPGDVVLFRRGDQWREQLVPHSGDESAHVTYGAYGAGPKPLLLGSVARNDPGDWRQEAPNVWATYSAALRVDVGNIIFDGGGSCGAKVWSENDLQQQGQYWYDERSRVLKLYSSECPATYYSEIECALRRHIVNESNAHYVIYENLALRYGGAHGIGGANTHHIVVRDCDLSYIGGGDQYG